MRIVGSIRRVGIGFQRAYKYNIKFRIGFTVLVALIIFGLIGLRAPPGYKQWYKLPTNLPPRLTTDLTYLLGTTSHGRSVFWSLTNGIINSLIIATITTLLAPNIGLMVGMVAGLSGGIIDRIFMFITDVIIVIPAFPLYIILAMLVRDWLSMYLVGLIITVTSWAWPARQVRSMLLSIREREFMITAKLSGMRYYKIILSEVMPHLIGWHLINTTNTVLYSIGSEAGLAILGLSILQEDTLGTIIYWAQQYAALYRGIIWWILSPIIVLIILFVSLYLISIGLTEYFTGRR